jgi:hypothetical protein
MRNLLEMFLFGLAACACFLSFYWGWQEIVGWWSGRHERRSRHRGTFRDPDR